ncbi:MAG: glycoside hydrolase family 16 protein [Candidatus Bathyarchaeia archaeon]
MKKNISAALMAAIMLLTPFFCCIYLETVNNCMVSAATNPTTIKFSGYIWNIKYSSQPANPGGNYWSNSPQNVWVDENGWLHLKITKVNGKWYCAEVTCTKTLGYGTYAFYLVSRTDNFDKNVVLGLFAYKDDSHEVDIEYTKWSNLNNKNGWFTVQPAPYIEGKNQRSFNEHLYGTYTTNYFIWKLGSIHFAAVGGHYQPGTEPADNIIQSFTSNSRVNPTGARPDINLWLYKGQAPSDGLPAEVVIKSFQYTPLP